MELTITPLFFIMRTHDMKAVFSFVLFFASIFAKPNFELDEEPNEKPTQDLDDRFKGLTFCGSPGDLLRFCRSNDLELTDMELLSLELLVKAKFSFRIFISENDFRKRFG